MAIPAGLGGTYQVDIELAFSGSPSISGAALTINGTDNAVGSAGTSETAVLLNHVYSATSS